MEKKLNKILSEMVESKFPLKEEETRVEWVIAGVFEWAAKRFLERMESSQEGRGSEGWSRLWVLSAKKLEAWALELADAYAERREVADLWRELAEAWAAWGRKWEQEGERWARIES